MCPTLSVRIAPVAIVKNQHTFIDPLSDKDFHLLGGTPCVVDIRKGPLHNKKVLEENAAFLGNWHALSALLQNLSLAFPKNVDGTL